jgi:hypothetical protein
VIERLRGEEHKVAGLLDANPSLRTVCLRFNSLGIATHESSVFFIDGTNEFRPIDFATDY